jgi:hypothetical protein
MLRLEHTGMGAWCITAKLAADVPHGVKSVGSTRPTTSRHVRCTSDSSQIGALQRFDEECQQPTYATQQKVSLFDHLIGEGE